MVRCNLSVLLAERNLSITKVSNDTGISRTTLTSLSSNNAHGIQFDTLNTLCLYLKVKPDQFITFFPANIELLSVTVSNANVTMELRIEKGLSSYVATLEGIILKEAANNIHVTFDLIPQGDAQNQALQDAIYLIRQLPDTFLSDLEMKIQQQIINHDPSVSCSFWWNKDII